MACWPPSTGRRRRSSWSTASRRSPTSGSSSSAGSVTQVRECAQALVIDAKRRGVPMVLVGHVTKDGTLAGPRVLEHVVDTVLSFEGERHHALRLLRAVKHRFGSDRRAGPVRDDRAPGCTGSPDPSKLFLADRRARGRRIGRRAGDGGTAAAARRGPGADGPDPAGDAGAAQRPGARRRPAGAAARRARAAGRAAGQPPRTSTPRRSAACGSSSRASISRWRWRSPARPPTGRSAPTSW